MPTLELAVGETDAMRVSANLAILEHGEEATGKSSLVAAILRSETNNRLVWKRRRHTSAGLDHTTNAASQAAQQRRLWKETLKERFLLPNTSSILATQYSEVEHAGAAA
jgi:hypothetical protein